MAGGFDGNGTYNRYYNFTNDALSGIDILASRMDTELNGFASALSNCITRDGQGKPTAAINWNGQNLTGVNNLSAAQISSLTQALSIANGGTGAGDGTAALTNLVAEAGGFLPVDLGGTGAITAAAALANLLSGSVISPGNGGTGVTSLGNLFTHSFGTNGYRRSLIDSFMIQWETTGVIGANAGASIYFPTSFPNLCLAAVACRNVVDTSNGGAAVYGVNASYCYVYNGAPNNAAITIIAVGY